VISRGKYVFAGIWLLLGASSAFANSTAFNGFAQTRGNSGVDLTNLGGGNYRVTLTRSGQLNFRYQIGNQVFDSNPEAAFSDTGETTDIGSWQGAGATDRRDRDYWAPTAGSSALAASGYYMLGATDRAQLLDTGSNEAATSAPDYVPTEPSYPYLSLRDSSGGSFDVTTLSPAWWNVANSNSVAFIGNNTGFVNTYEAPSWDPIVGLEDNPEPATFVLAAGALILGFAAFRRMQRATQQV
jgi:hypothetical protein